MVYVRVVNFIWMQRLKICFSAKRDRDAANDVEPKMGWVVFEEF